MWETAKEERKHHAWLWIKSITWDTEAEGSSEQNDLGTCIRIFTDY
jgi:hypothetical protein